MRVDRIDHISIAVRDLEAARAVWEPILGRDGPDDSYVDEREHLRVHRYWVGEVGFELMESTTPDGEVARFVAERGEGIMLISLHVDDAAAALGELEDGGYRTLGPPQPFRGGRYGFVHPHSATGVLLELIDQPPAGSADPRA